MLEDYQVIVLVVCCSIISGLFALYNAWVVKSIVLDDSYENLAANLKGKETVQAKEDGHPHVHFKVPEITQMISDGAKSFLAAEYRILLAFIGLFAIVILLLVGGGQNSGNLSNDYIFGTFSAIAFIVGALTSIACGYIGMRIATIANGRCTIKAIDGIGPAFVVAYKAGCVMGFALVGLGLIVLFIIIMIFRTYYGGVDQAVDLFESIAGYGLGGSSVALFSRVGGGIYTKAADVGSDLVGKVEKGIPEDDPRNAAVIADNVGDNVGDVAGMGADLFGSFAESSCAALVIASTSPQYTTSLSFMLFPLSLMSVGILVCLVTTFFATHIFVVKSAKRVEDSLKGQLAISTILATPCLFLITYYSFPMGEFQMAVTTTTSIKIFGCAISGLWTGLLIGFTTDYFTSNAHLPVKDVAQSCETGAATNIIYGLALGYKSDVIPIMALAFTICLSSSLAGPYGIAVAALGILSTMCIGLTIDAYGPISDNAGGIAEMAELGPEVRKLTDALDAAGNTTAAIGKGFAIASAALVSLALFSAFTTRVNPVDICGSTPIPIDILEPFTFAGLLYGAMLPYWFSAMTMKSVGKAALAMVEEVREQFRNNPGIMDGTSRPDYKRCVAISTKASLKEMILPGLLVFLNPIIIGFVFGKSALSGLLAGNLVSGVQTAISSSNTGGAWDNAKKYIEEGHHGGKRSDPHKAAVIGDTVGDPLKDTSGPSLNILIKLTAILSLILSPFIKSYGGKYFGITFPCDTFAG